MNDSDVVECNGARILELRRAAEITQDQLADAAGYSVRVIRNAEKSRAIRFSTLTAIATALQRYGSNATAADLCTDPVSIAQAFVEAYRVHEVEMVDQIRHLLCHELEVFIAGNSEQIPFAGTFHGPAGLQEFWKRFFNLIERYDKSALDLQYFVCGNEVVAYGTERGRLKGQETDEPTWLCLKFRIQDGLITRFEDYFDTASAQANISSFKLRMHQEAADQR